MSSSQSRFDFIVSSSDFSTLEKNHVQVLEGVVKLPNLNWTEYQRSVIFLISTFDNFQERIVTKCLENRVALYSPHTAFDAVQDGVNDWLISPFGKWRFMEYFNIDVKFSEFCRVYWFQFFKFVFLFLPHLPNVTISIIITQPFEFCKLQAAISLHLQMTGFWRPFIHLFEKMCFTCQKCLSL